MTTIISIRASDPEFSIPYVLLLADSKGNGSISDKTKLYSPKGSNYIVGAAGKILNEYYTKNDVDAQRVLSQGGQFTKSELEELLTNMNKQMQEEINETNNFFVALQSETPQSLRFKNEKLEDAGRYFTEGSGKKYASFVLKKLNDYFVGEDLLIVKKQDAIAIGVKAMKEAAKEDEGTGGKASVGIITPTFVNIIKDYAVLE